MPSSGPIFLCGRGYGTSFHAEKWLSLDLCGLLGVSCSWLIHIYALVVVAIQLISNSLFSTIIYFGLYVPIALLAMTSLYKAWTTNPGAVPLGARPLVVVRRAGSSDSGDRDEDLPPSSSLTAPTRRRATRRCHKCNDNYKPPRAHHDSVTGRCVVKFDHFCPWVGNAVGAMNHKFFCLFLLYTCITCTLSLLLIFMRALHCGYKIDAAEEAEGNNEIEGSGRKSVESLYKYPECDSFYSSHYVLGLFICSLVFLVFTCSMGCEQMEAIETGKGKIARMKMRVGDAGTEFRTVTEEFNEMFGGESPRISLHWFLPQTVRFPRGMEKVVLGYEWDETFDPEPYNEAWGTPGDHEMTQMESGGQTLAPQPIAAPTTRDALLTRESDMDLNDVSVHSDSSATGVKNRKSPPPGSRPID